MKLQSPEVLKAFIKQRGASYDDAARYVGCSKGFISHLTAGRKSTCTPATATRIAEFLDVPLEVLFVPHLSAGSGQTTKTQRKAVAA